jgi:hypothetical protein
MINSLTFVELIVAIELMEVQILEIQQVAPVGSVKVLSWTRPILSSISIRNHRSVKRTLLDSCVKLDRT